MQHCLLLGLVSVSHAVYCWKCWNYFYLCFISFYPKIENGIRFKPRFGIYAQMRIPVKWEFLLTFTDHFFQCCMFFIRVWIIWSMITVSIWESNQKKGSSHLRFLYVVKHQYWVFKIDLVWFYISRYPPMGDALNETGRSIFYSICEW